jgi:hypothetical protein
MFFYTLPILFNNIRSVSPTECLLMALALFALLYISVSVDDENWQPQPYTHFLLTSWLGGMSLYWVFWPFFLLLNASLVATDLLAKNGLITVSGWDDIHFVLLFPIAWWTISLWRCSGNTRLRIWAALARWVTVALFVEYGLKLLIRIDYPRMFFNCEDLLLDYGSCF